MIRKATILDQEQITMLAQKSFMGIGINDYRLSEKEAILQYLKSIDYTKVITDESTYVIAFENKILAFGSYDNEKNQITNLYVDPEYKGWYFGEKLLEKLEQDAQENGFLEISVDSYLTAVQFFQNHKYYAIKKQFHDYNNQKILTYFMKKYFL